MPENEAPPNGADESHGKSTPHSLKSGWDGKLRVNKQATLANPEALSDPEYSDEDAPPVDQIAADEGTHTRLALTERASDHPRST